ncbi:GAF domain-containing protein [Bradyrhizobium diazoefficiens]|uniref:GAF domain-containing protein n=1 Tax=Bradyrhizobium diazoefficiens TaxID=1355477 RepID=UPI00190D8C4A|nr:GAF domain-containing protein [Bradyrhizobium diazoefficiens]MBK3660768.1 GAF domain-containing protein [Bradyrhizobium diazoefficiens]
MARISKAGGEKTKAKARKASPANGRKTAKTKGRKTQVAAPRKGRSIVELTKELDKALARQDATAEILKVISASPTDVKSVFDAICATAARLFNCDLTGVFWIEGATLTAITGAFADRLFEQHEHAPDMPLAADHNFPAMAAVEKRTVHVPNYLATQLPAHEQYISDRYGIKCGLYLPLLRNSECIGVFVLTASKPDHFSGQDIAVAESFRDQALIAIQNARLFNETKEALEQQTATAEILSVMSSSPTDVTPVFEAIAERARELSGSRIGSAVRFDGELLHMIAFRGSSPEAEAAMHAAFPMKPGNGSLNARVIAGLVPLQIPDIDLDPAYQLGDVAKKGDYRALLAVPMIHEGRAIGAIGIGRDEPGLFPEKIVTLLQTFASQAVIAIENVRLFNETREALEQQTATADVLKVISRSAFDLDSVMHALARSAAELCAAGLCGLYIREGDFLVCRGYTTISKEQEDFVRQARIPAHDPNFATTRVLSSGEIANIGDFKNDRSVAMQAFREKLGFKSLLIVPLMREGQGIGLFILGRDRVGQFSPRHVELVQTFADQAVIAIENSRLFDEVQARTRDLSEALTYQTGSANILNVIASSPTDAAPVLKAIVESACEVCEAYDAAVLLRDGDDLRFSAHHGPIPIGLEKWPINRRWTAGRAFVDQQPVHVEDLRDEKHADFTDGRELSLKMGHRTIASVPLLRDKESVGAIVLRRVEVHPFSGKQIAQLQTFADQAVIAIENVRLFDEVQAKTSDLEESLQQQIATADVLKVISRSAFDLQTVLETLTRSAVELCSANRGIVLLRDGDMFHFRAHSHPHENPDWIQFLRQHPQKAGRNSASARSIQSGQTVCVPDVLADPEIDMPATALAGIRAVLAVPLLRESKVEGLMVLSRRVPGPFNSRQIDLVQTFADQAVIAIENTRLFNETKQALAYQTGSSNVLRVIASSPTDVEPVLKEIVESARELCEANDAVVLLKDAEHLRFSAHSGPIPVTLDKWPISRNWTAGRAFVDQKPVHVHDMLSGEGAEFPDARSMGQSTGATIHTVLSVPLLRGNESIGAILLRRTEVRPFNDKQINLLSTFADQAVIAIQNARLFNETREALERQTATADILKVIASSPSDLQPVFEAIAERSNRLVSGLSTTVLSIVDDTIHLSAFTRTNPKADAALTASFPRQLSAMPFGEPIRQGAIYSLTDTETEPVLRDLARMRGYRSMLFVPLLRDGTPIGMIGQTRVEPGPFAVNHIQLLKTFADQAVIAISNVRLFQEVRERTRELSQSLDDLRTAQDRLVQTEKLASLGQLTAGIAHEIKNPLNFVNNFSALSVELIDEMTDIFESPTLDEAGRRKELDEIRELLKSNLEKVVQHGKRADSIVKNMLLHSREGSGEQRAVDINALLEESLNLAYHGARAEKPDFNITLQRDLDPDAGVVELFPQEITRALLNLISNGFYAASKREADNDEADFEPVLGAATRNLGNHIEIRIRDNGTGIPPDVKEKMFNPFFTTKPAGEGTGLGLSMSHDIIVKQHGGWIEVDTQPGQFTEFTIVLPRAVAPANDRPANNRKA